MIRSVIHNAFLNTNNGNAVVYHAFQQFLNNGNGIPTGFPRVLLEMTPGVILQYRIHNGKFRLPGIPCKSCMGAHPPPEFVLSFILTTIYTVCSCAVTNLKVGAPIGRKAPEKNFLVVPLHFLALKAQLVVLV